MAADDAPGGTFSHHEPADKLVVLVGPSAKQQFNTLRMAPPVLACWRLEDLRFEFDSSFVLATAADEFTLLASAYEELKQPALSVFGHADPVGDDEYNKVLAGRRAQAVYAVLVRDADLWDDLYTHPWGGDNWQSFAVDRMKTRLGASAPSARKDLYLAYMDAICRRKSGDAFSVDRKKFLGGGADQGGKADYQGCSEFNPIRVFSISEDQELNQPARHAERNQKNAVNRRVLVFLFRPGFTIDPGGWPCPRAKEPSAGCRKQFWPDGDKRRNPQDNHREYAKDKNTFACAFYDAMARFSPCEAVRKTLELRLFDATQKFIKNAPYRLTAGSHESRTGTAGADGRLREENLLAGSTLKVEWGFENDKEPYPFQLTIRLDFTRGSDDEQNRKRLNNLGYRLDDNKSNVRSFKEDYGITPLDDNLDPAAATKLKQIHDQRLSAAEFKARS